MAMVEQSMIELVRSKDLYTFIFLDPELLFR